MSTRRWRLALVAISVVIGSSLTAIPTWATTGSPAPYSASGRTAPNGQSLADRLAPSSIIPRTPQSKAAAAQPTFPVECPPVLMSKCHVVPAAYAQTDPNDKSIYGNYDLANRPRGGLLPQPGVSLRITGIVEHDTEASLASTLATFRNPASYVSANYVIDSDGQIYQTVPTKNIAFAAGNWYTNIHTVSIEHVGKAVNGRIDYTPAMYLSSALLDRYLALRFGFPMDRAHIIGHDNVPGPTPDLVAGMHWDPGPFWNWQLEFALMGAPLPRINLGSSLVTITKPFVPDDSSPLSDCSSSCVVLPKQATNFAYLHTAPSNTAPLLSDPALHPDGSPGTTQIDDWSATAVYGQQFVVAGRQKDWTGIWYGGQIGWFYNPGQLRNALPTRGRSITPRPELSSIPVYGRAYPEASAYAGTLVPVQAIVPLQYTVASGQHYSTSGVVPTDYYWTWYIDASLNASDHTVVAGRDIYLQIQFNHRVAYVRRADVIVR